MIWLANTRNLTVWRLGVRLLAYDLNPKVI